MLSEGLLDEDFKRAFGPFKLETFVFQLFQVLKEPPDSGVFALQVNPELRSLIEDVRFPGEI